jgi:transcription elongation GreA/GreB family factor
MQIPKRRSDMLRKPDDGPVHITQQGLERLHERHITLTRSLPDLIADAAQTAAQGDRSENDGYKEAKALLRRTYRKIYSIEDQIKRAVVITTGANAAGTVEIGSTVTMEIDGVRKTFQILGSHETNPSRGRISYQSPLGAALIHHTKGEVITFKTETGIKEYRIIDVS